MGNPKKENESEGVNLRDPQVWQSVMKNLLQEIAQVHEAIKKDGNNPKLVAKHGKELEVLSGVLDKLRENNPDALKRQSALETLGKGSRILPREIEKKQDLKPKTLSAEIRKEEAKFLEELKAKEAVKSSAPEKDINVLLKEAMDVLDKSLQNSSKELNELEELEKMAKSLGVDVGDKTPKSGGSH